MVSVDPSQPSGPSRPPGWQPWLSLAELLLERALWSASMPTTWRKHPKTLLYSKLRTEMYRLSLSKHLCRALMLQLGVSGVMLHWQNSCSRFQLLCAILIALLLTNLDRLHNSLGGLFSNCAQLQGENKKANSRWDERQWWDFDGEREKKKKSMFSLGLRPEEMCKLFQSGSSGCKITLEVMLFIVVVVRLFLVQSFFKGKCFKIILSEKWSLCTSYPVLRQRSYGTFIRAWQQINSGNY